MVLDPSPYPEWSARAWRWRWLMVAEEEERRLWLSPRI